MMRLNRRLVFVVLLALLAATPVLQAAPYASNVSISGTTVNFILNEPADVLSYSLNGGAAVTLDGTSKGAKTFSLGAPTDTFSIFAEKDAAVGYTIPTGVLNPGSPTQTNQWTQPSNGSGFNLISDDANMLTRFNSPRGLDINRNPNTANFGTSYIANSAAGATTIPAGDQRTLGDGLYAIRADQSDAFGYGDTGQNPNNTLDGFPSFVASASSPYRIFLKDDGDLYVSDYSDANGQVFKISPNLLTSTNVFSGFGGPSPCPCPPGPTTPDGTGLPVGQNHGSISSVWVEGSLANSNLVVWGMDEDLNTAHVSGVNTDPQNDRNSLWRWDVGGALNHASMPTKISSGLIGDFPAGGITVDMVRGPDGKFYMGQLRSTTTSNTLGLLVADSSGTIVYNSLDASRTLLGNPTAPDILTNNGGMAISPDGNWLGIIINSSDVGLIPLVDGIPDLANRLIVDSSLVNGENTGRDIAFDAAGNLHYVSSGQQRYRVLAPGGHTLSTLAWNGSSYTFDVENVEEGLDGDFNGDGVVDAADYVGARKIGAQADIDAFFENFGESSPGGGGSGGVPEPAAGLLAAIGMCIAGGCRRRLA